MDQHGVISVMVSIQDCGSCGMSSSLIYHPKLPEWWNGRHSSFRNCG